MISKDIIFLELYYYLSAAMDNEDTPKETKTKQRFNVLTNPTLMGLIAIIGLPLGAWGIYQGYAFNKEAKPVYRVISDVIVNQRSPHSKIKVFYDSVEVQNVRAVTIVLWNAGNDFLDKRAFSTEKPISIGRSTSVKILEAKVLHTTRPDLKLSCIYKISKLKSSSTGHIDVNILGDEGLEANDGATFLLLYTSPIEGKWNIKARIKGIPSGFQEATVPSTFFSWKDVFILIIMASMFYNSVRIYKKEGYSRSNIGLVLLSGFCMIMILLFNLKTGYQTITYLNPPEVLIK